MFGFQVHSVGAEYRKDPACVFDEKGKARRSLFKVAKGYGNSSPAGNAVQSPMPTMRIDLMFSR